MSNNLVAGESTPEQLEFFESKIRPVLIRECYECHNTAETQEGNLSLDHKSALLKGGDHGPLLVLNEPSKSLLLQVLKHEVEDLEMPEGGAKLSEAVIADFEKWISMGAPDPRVEPPSNEELAESTSWDAVREKRKQWWSFQPLEVNGKQHASVDQYIEDKLKEAGLSLSERADKRTLIRRLAFTLTGLPPTKNEIERFVNDELEDAFEKLVDHYLASPRYGEHWARHWMDWVRYAETHGSEGDPVIPNAWQYRDYLIRALNADVPYDALVMEHVAGDLLEHPRINAELGINESAIGPVQWRMCFHGFAPTDALDEKVRFTDDSINVFSKAFLGLTVSCARCHNHKFDPISQADYYALFGILGSTHPSIVDVNTQEKQSKHIEELTTLKAKISKALPPEWNSILDERGEDRGSLSNGQSPGESTEANAGIRFQWNLADQQDFAAWTTAGKGISQTTTHDFTINHDGETNVFQLLPHGTYSHLLSTKHRGILCSPRVTLQGEQELWVQVAGDGDAVLRYVVHDYPRNGTVYPFIKLNGGEWKWERFDLAYWNGEEIHVEVSTAADQPVLSTNKDRSWIGVRRVVIADKGTWNPPTDSDLKVSKQLPNELAAFNPELVEMLKSYRELEAKIPVPFRVPGLLEAGAVDQPLMIRGDHRKLGDPVPRRFLEVIDSEPYVPHSSGRLELAADLFRDDNPLTSRVIVNRLWHYLYGAGLVRTPDNFGRLGDVPSHPELLDYLACKMRDDGWSIKQMIRVMVTTHTWQQQSTPSTEAIQLDPDNRLLSHANLRRLEAESIRDQLLSLSGRLNDELYGPPHNGTNHNRRSVYTAVRRNDLDPFLAVFDAPTPFATVGKRDATNVPAQSLTLLNDPFIHGIAKDFSNRPEANELLDRERVAWYYETALGREATAEEVKAAMDFQERMMVEQHSLQIRHREMKQQQARFQDKLDEIIDPIRRQLQEDIDNGSGPPANAPTPTAHWTFSNGFQDSIGQLHLKPHGSAVINQKPLTLDGMGYVSTPPLPMEIKARTLQVVVQLNSLDQRGGGAMSLQTLEGHTFDAIVFGEQEPKRWLAGSNNFQRTMSFDGPDESVVHKQPVQLTMVYEEDGTIRCYRNGELYGTPYRKSERVTYPKQGSQLVFGLRHGTGVGGNRMLEGTLHEAKFYDHALNADEIALTARLFARAVSNEAIFERLTSPQIENINELKGKIQDLQLLIDELGEVPQIDSRWIDLAHAILNLKEIIYLR